MLATETWERGTHAALAASLAAREAGLRDRWVTGGVVRAVVDFGEVLLEVAGVDRLALSGLAHAQLAETLGVPAAYAARCRDEAPDIAAGTLNDWLVRCADQLVLRVGEGTVRAVLNPRRAGRPMVGDLAAAVRRAGAVVMAWAHGESRSWLRLAAGPVLPGGYRAGGLVTGSSYGAGAVAVQAIVATGDGAAWVAVPGYPEPDEDTLRRDYPDDAWTPRLAGDFRRDVLAGVERLAAALRDRADVWQSLGAVPPKALRAALGEAGRGGAPEAEVARARRLGAGLWAPVRWHR